MQCEMAGVSGDMRACPARQVTEGMRLKVNDQLRGLESPRKMRCWAVLLSGARCLLACPAGCRYAVGPHDALTGIAGPVAADARPVPGAFPLLF